MCLSNASEKLIATRDIKCYTVAKRDDKRLYTPYRKCPISKFMKSNIDLPNNGVIKRGLHSLRTKKDVRKELGWWKGVYEYNYVILSWIIPKGSIYYKGDFENVNDSYVSNKRHLIGEIE
jgi:hypothetical protein